MRLSRHLNRCLNHRLRCCLTRRLDGRPWCSPNYLAVACNLLERYLRRRLKAARDEPHLFGPCADRYRQDTLQMEQDQREIAAMLLRVYGPDPAGAPARRSVWEERYEIPTEQMPVFRKWFQENYGS